MKLLRNVKASEFYSLAFAWLQSLEFRTELKSSYAPKRLERWFMKGSNLQSIADGRAEIVSYEKPPDFVIELGREVYPDFDSILVCKGHKPTSDTSIEWHRDHGHFVAKAVMLNFGRSEYSEWLYSGEKKTEIVNDGDVLDIDTKIVHRSLQLSDLRYNVTFRKLKTEYASNTLF